MFHGVEIFPILPSSHLTNTTARRLKYSDQEPGARGDRREKSRSQGRGRSLIAAHDGRVTPGARRRIRRSLLASPRTYSIHVSQTPSSSFPGHSIIVLITLAEDRSGFCSARRCIPVLSDSATCLLIRACVRSGDAPCRSGRKPPLITRVFSGSVVSFASATSADGVMSIYM